MGSLAVLTMDVELAQHMQAAPVSKKYSWSRMVVALAAAVAASAATAYAVRHNNRSGDGPQPHSLSLQRRLGEPTIIADSSGDLIHEDSWTCVPQESDCDLFSETCLRMDPEKDCAKKYFGQVDNEDECHNQHGDDGYITHWCPYKDLLAGCNKANQLSRRPNLIVSRPVSAQVHFPEGYYRQNHPQGEEQPRLRSGGRLRVPDVRVLSDAGRLISATVAAARRSSVLQR